MKCIWLSIMFVALGLGCNTFSKPEDETLAEIRQIPGRAEYAVFGPHRFRGGLAITGLPENASEESIAAAQAGTYNGPVVWALNGSFTFGNDSYRVLEPTITVGKSMPERVNILLTVVPPLEEVPRITVTQVPVEATVMASPQAQFTVRVQESKK
jgi:hypothetical protein